MYRFTLFEMIKEEFKKNNKLSEEFLQKIRDIGPITQYATAHIKWSISPSTLGNCPQIKEDLRKIKTTADLYHVMERLKAFDDKYLPQDVWHAPIIMHAFIPKNRD